MIVPALIAPPSVFLSWNRWTQIVTSEAPRHVKAFVEWSQKNLDELEFSEILVLFEDILKPPTPDS